MDDSDALDDKTLVLNARRGDTGSFDELVRRYQGPITAVLYRFCPQRADLEDLVQETMIKAYRKLDRWTDRAPFEHWLKRLAVNVGYDFLRRERRSSVRIALDSRDPEFDPMEWISDNDTALDDGQRAEIVHWMLAKLDPDDRTILTLQYLHEMSLEEVSNSLGWSRTRTKVKSFRARRKLQTILKRHGIAEV